jgi:hypothetical protein
MTIDELADALGRVRFRYASEDELQEGIEGATRKLFPDAKVMREVILSARDRIDLMVDGFGVEVKVAGATRSLRAQVERYVEHDDVEGVVIVTSRTMHLGIPPFLNGKPIRILAISVHGL